VNGTSTATRHQRNISEMFGRKKWLLVHTLVIDNITVKNSDRKGKLYFYLYETKDGRRKEEHKFVGIQANDNMDNITDYWDTVYPWLNGTNVQGISTYWQAMCSKLKDDVKEIYKRMLSY